MIINMKNKVILILMFYISYIYNCNAKNIEFEVTGKAIIEGFLLSDNSSYKIYKSEGYWKSSLGDYGLNNCYGILENDIEKKINLNILCKYSSKDNENIIFKFTRNSSFQDAGMGKATIIDASKKYKYLIGTNCSHAVSYVEDAFFAMQNCKLINDQ